MPDYISKRGKRDGWRYTFHIPVELRPLWGNKTAFRKYIPPMPVARPLPRRASWQSSTTAGSKLPAKPPRIAGNRWPRPGAFRSC